ncbi:MAG: RNA polymerase sigma factor, partial [Pirellulales bacterium]|nr:RNA polymerase sigma factor [Pirellulales bacterium]
MSDELDEAAIVRGLRNGDRDAWETLYQAYSDRVYRYVTRLLGRDRETVTDVFQETMLAAARNGRGLQEETKLWAWLSTIAHRLVALHWRQVYRRSFESLQSELAAEAQNNDPQELLCRAETNQSVRIVLA